MLHFIKSTLAHFEKQPAPTQCFLRICRWTILKGIFLSRIWGEALGLAMLQNWNLTRNSPWYIKSTDEGVFYNFLLSNNGFDMLVKLPRMIVVSDASPSLATHCLGKISILTWNNCHCKPNFSCKQNSPRTHSKRL